MSYLKYKFSHMETLKQQMLEHFDESGLLHRQHKDGKGLEALFPIEMGPTRGNCCSTIVLVTKNPPSCYAHMDFYPLSSITPAASGITGMPWKIGLELSDAMRYSVVPMEAGADPSMPYGLRPKAPFAFAMRITPSHYESESFLRPPKVTRLCLSLVIGIEGCCSFIKS